MHDLKTPVSIVQGNAELLKVTDLTDEQKDYVEYIIKKFNTYIRLYKSSDGDESVN